MAGADLGVQFTHLLLVVQAVPESTRFYENVCGLSRLHSRVREDGQLVQWMGSSRIGARLILVDSRPGEQPIGPYGHIGLSCASLEQYNSKLEAAWPYIEAGPRNDPWPLGDWFSVLDPDNNRVEISFGQDGPQPKDQRETYRRVRRQNAPGEGPEPSAASNENNLGSET